MLDHVRRQVADMIGREIAPKIEIIAPAQIQCDGDERLVHRQAEAVTPDAPLVAKGLLQRNPQRDGAVLDGVVRVGMKIAVAFQLIANPALGDLVKHMVVKPDAGIDPYRRLAVEIHATEMAVSLVFGQARSALDLRSGKISPPEWQEGLHLVVGADRHPDGTGKTGLMRLVAEDTPRARVQSASASSTIIRK